MGGEAVVCLAHLARLGSGHLWGGRRDMGALCVACAVNALKIIPFMVVGGPV